MRSLLVLSLVLLPALLVVAAPASAGPSCGAPDKTVAFVRVWHGGGGCFGAHSQHFPQQACNFDAGLDRPYALVWTTLCSATVLVQP